MIPLTYFQEAAERIRAAVVETSLVESDALNQLLGGRILLKAECLQRTGSFKLRGAYNRIAKLTPHERKCGVVAFSSGNHAQGVAAAAQQAGVEAHIIMPSDAPALKIDNTRNMGANVVLYDRQTGDRAQIAKDLSEKTGAILVPPYDDPDIIEGQGTVGLEICSQLQALGLQADALLAPIGGGGLMAGLSSSVKALSPATDIYCVEPEGFDDTARSLDSGMRLSNEAGESICDSIVTLCPGEMTFPINQANLAGGLVVCDADVRKAMKVAFERLKLVVEPGGAVGLAALLAGKFDCSGKVVVVVLSGGNIGADDFVKFIS